MGHKVSLRTNIPNYLSVFLQMLIFLQKENTLVLFRRGHRFVESLHSAFSSRCNLASREM